MKKKKSEALATEAPPAVPEDQAVPVEVLDVIPGDQPAFSGWDDPAINAAQAGWPENTCQRQCFVVLTPEEIVCVSDAEFAVADELAKAAAKFDLSKALWKKEESELSGKAAELEKKRRDKREEREVPARWIFGFRPGRNGAPIHDPNCKTLIRTDTMQAETHDAISDEDRQPNLFPDEEMPRLPEPEEDAAEEPEGETEEDTEGES